MENVKRAALYCRVSTEEQVKINLSIPAQLNSLREYCMNHKWKIVGEYIDEGISGQKGYTKRPAMEHLLEDVESGMIDIIVFIKLDRWFRSTKEYYRAQTILDKHNVEWVATTEDYNTNTSSGRLNLNVRLAVAQAEAETTSDRIKFVFEDKRKRGEVCSGNVPYGYKIDDRKHMVIDEDTAPVARWLFKTYLEGRSVKKLSEDMFNIYGVSRCYSNVAIMLSNEKYVTGGLIDKDTFDAVQKVLKQRSPNCSNRKHNIYLFKAVYCNCGRKTRATTVKGISYYNCVDCHKYYRESKIEQYGLQMVADEAKLRNLRIHAEKQKKKEDPEKYRKRMNKLVQLYLNDMIEMDDYRREYEILQQKIKDCSNVEPEKPINVEAIEKAMELYGDLNKENKSALWSRMIQRIDIDPEGSYKITFI